MTGRTLHDALLKVVSDGTLRRRLRDGDPQLSAALGSAEAAVLGRLSGERLARLSRFLARHYYRERIVRLYRHVRLLAAVTGRDPLAVLETAEGVGFLDQAALGSLASAEQLLVLIEQYLTRDDDALTGRLPYWRDLLRYQAAMLRAEAIHEAGLNGSGRPRPSPSLQRLELEWDIPAVVVQLKKRASVPVGHPARTLLLVARSRHGRVTAVRCTEPVRRVLEQADGKRDRKEIARTCGLAQEHLDGLLRQLFDIGVLS
jgi:hypothetical protein